MVRSLIVALLLCATVACTTTTVESETLQGCEAFSCGVPIFANVRLGSYIGTWKDQVVRIETGQQFEQTTMLLMKGGHDALSTAPTSVWIPVSSSATCGHLVIDFVEEKYHEMSDDDRNRHPAPEWIRYENEGGKCGFTGRNEPAKNPPPIPEWRGVLKHFVRGSVIAEDQIVLFSVSSVMSRGSSAQKQAATITADLLCNRLLQPMVPPHKDQAQELCIKILNGIPTGNDLDFTQLWTGTHWDHQRMRPK